MADWGDYTNHNLAPADKAVAYLLERARRDPDLRWLLLGTQAFALLCEAEAVRSGRTRDEVGATAATPVAHRDANRPARLETHADLLAACEEVLERECARDNPSRRTIAILEAAIAKVRGEGVR